MELSPEDMAALEAEFGQEQPAMPDLSPQDIQALEAEFGNREKASNFDSFMTGAADGATFGFGDEMRAGLQAAVRGTLDPNVTIGQSYDHFLNKYRDTQEQRQEDNPYFYGGGQIAGAVGGTGAALAPFKATGTIAKLGKYARSKPLRSAAGTSGISGSIYGFGSGEGGFQERLEEGAYTGGAGAALGPVGARAGQAVGDILGSRPAQNLLGRAKNILGKSKPGIQVTRQPSAQASPMSGTTLSPEIKAEQGAKMRLPTGAATDDVKMMRAEEAARQGLLGDDYAAQIKAVDEQFLGDAQRAVENLAGRKGASDELLESGIEKVKKRAAAEKRFMGSLMEKRNDSIAKAKVYKDYTSSTLGKQIDELKQTPDFKVNLPKESNAAIRGEIKSLNDLLKRDGKDYKMVPGIYGKKKVPISSTLDFDELQAWRKGLNDYRPGTQEGVMAGKLAKSYDNWLEGLERSAIKEGDEDLADQIFNANKKYSEFKGRFGTDKYKGQSNIIEKIVVQDELTPDHLVNMAFGSSVKGKSTTNQTVKRMLEALPEGYKREALKGDLKAGLVMRAFENSYKGDSLKVGRLKDELLKLKDNRAFKDSLANPIEIKALDDIISDLSKYIDATSRRDVYSPSGPAVLRGLEGLMNMVGGVASPLGGRAITEPIKSMVKEGKLGPDRRLVEKSLERFGKNLQDAGKSTYRTYGAASTAPLANDATKLFLTVRPGEGMQPMSREQFESGERF